MNRIVLIEDDPAILFGLADNLRSESYDVLTAADGENGYRLVREKQPDLVILDLMLPGLDGYEVCRRIRRHGLATPILMLTAQSLETNRVDGFEAGADDYVTKPFSLRELLGRVRAILRRSEGRADMANQRELDEARRIQEELMPASILQTRGLRIAATWRPARIVGGDYFDVLQLDQDTVAICIADVSGKGMPAALMMSNLQATVRAHAYARMRPRDLCARVNAAMCDNTPAHGFVSFFYAVIASARKQLTYCNAGHNPPLVYGQAGLRRLECGGGIVGAFRDWPYDDEAIQLASGDRILMYTDGLTECRNLPGEEFGEERLIELIARAPFIEAATLADEVVRETARFSNENFEDDLTVVAVSVE
jgi:sigma-B regulation protein RsbU (phosphoserine phosphatase)